MVIIMVRKIFYSWFFIVGCTLGISAAMAEPNQQIIIAVPAN